MIIRKCAWCGCTLGTVEDEREGVSHGICETCKSKHFKGKGKA